MTFSIWSRQSACGALIKPRNARLTLPPPTLRVTRTRSLTRNQKMGRAETSAAPAENIPSVSIEVQEKGDGIARFLGPECYFEQGRTATRIQDIPPLDGLYSTGRHPCTPLAMSAHCERDNSNVELTVNSCDSAITGDRHEALSPTPMAYRLPGLPMIEGEPLKSPLFAENSLPPLGNHETPPSYLPSSHRICLPRPDVSSRNNLLSASPTSIMTGGALNSTSLTPASAHSAISNRRSNGSVRRGRTFDGLVDDILQHPSFPLIFKGAYQSSTGIPPKITDARTADAIQLASEKSEAIEEAARSIGVHETLERVNTIDFFFCVLNAAFKSLQAELQPPLSSSLHSTMNSCAQAPANGGTLGSFGSANAPPTPDSLPDDSMKSKLSEYARNRLEEWFVEHFSNPYPTKEEKMMLAQECELTIGQVSPAY